MSLLSVIKKIKLRTRIKMYGLLESVLPQCLSIGNLIPDFNDMVHQEEWQGA
jgi:hypothetical protein